MIRRWPSDALLPCFLFLATAAAFAPLQVLPQASQAQFKSLIRPPTTTLFGSNNRDAEDAADIEDARMKILQARRKQVRQTLKSAEALRNFRLKNGLVPEIDEETGKPISDGKVAVTFTAFLVAAGAIALRVGGRAALVSAVGLDFLTDSPELKENLDMVITTADTMDPAQKFVIFTACWTAVKIFCFDAGGVVLALSSGILFGGVIQGALLSAGAATVGSYTAFSLAKADTPVREKALELLEEYPSLRGIEKVVSRDGLKAILTLRLAPVLPIPIGMYNYIYGVTNVPVTAFCGGIFLGSLKPYLLDSYLGYFGKEVIQGTSDASGMQDVLLLGALGVSVLIGVFASQLAGETWDSVLEEVELEKKAKNGDDVNEEDEDDGLTREVFGVQLPEWTVGFQIGLKEADERINDFILEEEAAKVWNYTASESIPVTKDPAKFPGSLEVTGADQGFDFVASICDGLVLSPLLFGAFLKRADPMYNDEDKQLPNLVKQRSSSNVSKRQDMLQQLQDLKSTANERIDELDGRIREQRSNE